MANQLVVCLVSEQTIPNVQFLKWYFTCKEPIEEVDLLLVTTKEMEKSGTSDKIANTAKKFKHSCQVYLPISVEEYDVQDIKNKLGTFFKEHRYEKVVANITGGTKIMSLAVYQYITEMKDSVVYYKPYKKGQDLPLKQLFPEQKTESDDVSLNLDEYLSALGLDYEPNDEKSFQNYSFNRELYKCLRKNSNGLRFFTALNTKNEDETWNLCKMDVLPNNCYKSDEIFAKNIVQYLKMDPERLPKNFKYYILGGWFEQFVYQYVRNKFQLPDSQIALNIKVKQTNNEYDVMYVYENKLHVIECKAFLQESNKISDKITEALYKLKALKDSLGLASQEYFYTTTKKVSEAMFKRAKDLKITIVDGNMLEDL